MTSNLTTWLSKQPLWTCFHEAIFSCFSFNGFYAHVCWKPWYLRLFHTLTLSPLTSILPSQRGPIAPSWCLLIDQFSWTFDFLPIRSRKLFNRFFRFAKTYRHAFVRSRELLHGLSIPYIWLPGLVPTVSTLAPDWCKGIAPRLPSSQPLFLDFPLAVIGYFLLFFSSCFMLFR